MGRVMKMLFGPALACAALVGTDAGAACLHADNRAADTRTMLAATLVCGDSAVGFRQANFIANQPQRDDVAFVAFLALLQAELAAERRKR